MAGNRFQMMGNYGSNCFVFFFPWRNTAVVSCYPEEKKNKLLVFFYYAFFKTKWKKNGNKNSDHDENAQNSKIEEQKCLLP